MCGRVICALSSDELLKIAKAKAINNSMKYRKSYNIGPERYLAGIFKKNTNRNFKEKEMDIIDKEESQENNQKIFAINNSVEVLINEFLSFDENDKNIQHIINYRKNVLKNYEAVLNQHNILKQYYKCFTEATKEIEIFNENMISRIEEKLNVAKQLFNVENIKKSLANISLSK